METNRILIMALVVAFLFASIGMPVKAQSNYWPPIGGPDCPYFRNGECVGFLPLSQEPPLDSLEKPPPPGGWIVLTPSPETKETNADQSFLDQLLDFVARIFLPVIYKGYNAATPIFWQVVEDLGWKENFHGTTGWKYWFRLCSVVGGEDGQLDCSWQTFAYCVSGADVPRPYVGKRCSRIQDSIFGWSYKCGREHQELKEVVFITTPTPRPTPTKTPTPVWTSTPSPTPTPVCSCEGYSMDVSYPEATKLWNQLLPLAPNWSYGQHVIQMYSPNQTKIEILRFGRPFDQWNDPYFRGIEVKIYGAGWTENLSSQCGDGSCKFSCGTIHYTDQPARVETKVTLSCGVCQGQFMVTDPVAVRAIQIQIDSGADFQDAYNDARAEVGLPSFNLYVDELPTE